MPQVNEDEIPGAVEIDNAGQPAPLPPPRRGRGRPKGSLNKKTLARLAAAAKSETPETVSATDSSAAGGGTLQPTTAQPVKSAVQVPSSHPAQPVASAPKPSQAPKSPQSPKATRTPSPAPIVQPAASQATQTPPVQPPASQSVSRKPMRLRRG